MYIAEENMKKYWVFLNLYAVSGCEELREKIKGVIENYFTMERNIFSLDKEIKLIHTFSSLVSELPEELRKTIADCSVTRDENGGAWTLHHEGGRKTYPTPMGTTEEDFY